MALDLGTDDALALGAQRHAGEGVVKLGFPHAVEDHRAGGLLFGECRHHHASRVDPGAARTFTGCERCLSVLGDAGPAAGDRRRQYDAEQGSGNEEACYEKKSDH